LGRIGCTCRVRFSQHMNESLVNLCSELDNNGGMVSKHI